MPKFDKHVDDPSKYWCVAPGCTADGRKKKNFAKYPWMRGVQFFPFPGSQKDPRGRRLWLRQLRRDNYVLKKHHRLCSLHFKDGKPTKENNIPTLFPRNNFGKPLKARGLNSILKRSRYHDNVHEEVVEEISPPKQRYRECNIPGYCNTPPVLKEVEVLTSNQHSRNGNILLIPQPEPAMCLPEHSYSCASRCNISSSSTKDASTQTTLGGDAMDKMERNFQIMEQNLSSVEKKMNDSETMRKDLFVQQIISSDKSVKKYTGLPSLNTVHGIFNVLNENQPNLKYWSGQKSANEKDYEKNNTRKPGPPRKLSNFEEFLLTLVMFRLGLVGFFVADMFGISRARVSQIFITWISYLYVVFSPLLKWPSRAKIDKHMPKRFKICFPKTRAIIDCTEFFIQKPRNPRAQSVTYSTYKSHNTYKVLVAINPCGAFSFISNFWGGNVSDRYITEHSGFLDLIEKGDQVMADRGFTISDLLLEKRATLKIPPFTRKCTYGKGRCLFYSEILATRQLSKLRVHVERAIGRLKRFRLLSHVLPLSLKPVCNQMVKVAAVFCNFYQNLLSRYWSQNFRTTCTNITNVT